MTTFAAMCGINGIFAFNGWLPVNTAELLSNMNHAIAYRGPDDEGSYTDPYEGVALGHRRLSIIDLSSAGHQPMVDHHKNAMVFNGEIYNYRELKKNITDYSFQSESDTEVLMTLLQRKGEQALHHLNGMFAFAWFNREKKSLLLARDRAGKKPVYYCSEQGYFAFSSEIKALLTLPWVKTDVDEEAQYHFLTFNHIDSPKTLFKGISKLGPGELMEVNKDGIKIRRWWQVEYQNSDFTNESKAADAVYRTLEESVAARMVSDVPVGAFLSGGVDSGAVVGLMSKMSSKPVKTFSVGFDQAENYDERKYAERVAKMFNTDHHEVVIKPEDISDFLPLIVQIFDDPLADSTAIPIYFLSKLARNKGAIVVQTGDGADEIFAGYRAWQKYLRYYPLFNMLKSMPAPVRGVLKGVAQLTEPDSVTGEMMMRAANQQEFFWASAKAFKESGKREFLTDEWFNKTRNFNSWEVINRHYKDFLELKKQNSALNSADWMCYLGLKMPVANRYLYRMDRLGMINSIEVRCPFLDYRMINLALSIPSSLKTKNGEPKYILKKSLEQLLPKEILYRKKMGFCVPIREWASQIMTDYVSENISAFSKDVPLFREHALQNMVLEIRAGKTRHTNNLWTVYYLMLWYKKWMGV
jgi:asparagine synthase (glutamine-hydrolysing)